MDGVELRHRIGLCLGVILGCTPGLADIDDKESRIETAGAHLPQVQLAAGIERVDRFGCEGGRNIVVTVDGHHRLMDGECAVVLHGFVILRGWCLRVAFIAAARGRGPVPGFRCFIVWCLTRTCSKCSPIICPDGVCPGAIATIRG